jgi:proliferating cell nuclear antigen PCNA
MIFKAVHSNPTILINLFESLGVIFNEITLSIQKDGIFSNTMDSAHICLASLDLEKEDFTEYNLNNNKEITISMHIASFISILKIAKNAKNIELSLVNLDKLNIVINTKYDSKKFTINLLNIESDIEMQMKDHDYPCVIEMSPNIYNEIISGCTVVESDAIEFIIKDNKLNIKADGNIGNFSHIFNNKEFREKKNLIIKKSSGETMKIKHPKTNSFKIYDCTGNFKLDFSLKYFKLFSKANSLSDKVSINLIAGNPIRLDYEIGNNGSILQYYLAPKINDE